MEKNPLGVRKGAWTKEEDILLKKCVEKYGEGKWHKVPLRAGLNRCRKSCRLRWLNYLRPNIKRGYFTKDEVDLIVRLHKLLGNRWSLIAGRLPGRTANDVKNFWNTHIDKKLSATSAAARESPFQGKTMQKWITHSNIIRPRPRTFSRSLQVPGRPSQLAKMDETNNDENPGNKQPSGSSAPLSQDQELKDCVINSDKNTKYKAAEEEEEADECNRWWSNLLDVTESGILGTAFWFSDEDNQILGAAGLGDGNNSTPT